MDHLTLASLARRIVRERSRPGSMGGLVAFLGAIVTLRFLANAYLAALMGPHLSAQSGAPFLSCSMGIVAVWAATAGATRAYRTTAYLLDHRRFRGARVRRSAIAAAAVRLSILRPTTAVFAILCLCAVGVSVALWGSAGLDPVHLWVPLAAAALCAPLSYFALRVGHLGDRGAENVETLVLLAVALLNPGLELRDGRFVFLGQVGLLPSDPWGVAALVAASPLALLAVCGITRLARVMERRIAKPHDPAKTPDPFLRLYRADLPLGLFVGSYLIEIPLVLASAIQRAGLVRLSLTLLALRVFWYVLFLARTTGRFTALRPAPLVSSRAQTRHLLVSAPYHAAVCALPLAALAARLLLV